MRLRWFALACVAAVPLVGCAARKLPQAAVDPAGAPGPECIGRRT